MSGGVVLRDAGIQASSYQLPRPGAAMPQPVSPPAAPAPSAVASLESRLAEKYQEGFLAGRAAQAEELSAQRRAAADQELRRAVEAAAQDGYAEGLAKAAQEARLASEQARSEVQRRIAALDALARSLADQRAASLLNAEDDLVALCHELVCRILGEAAPTLQGIRSMANQALRQLAGEAVAIHLHPDDLAVYAAGEGDRPGAVRWVADRSISLGGVVVRGSGGHLDARLETQLQTLADTLLAVREAGAAAAPVQA